MTEAPANSTAAEEPFPRGTALPPQSPLFWVAEKDRYLRQLLIRDIEEVTGRALLVYFTDCEIGDTSAQISPIDDTYLTELLGAASGKPVDLFLETNGGYTDAAEKILSVIKSLAPDLRVIVPRRAKSNGTLLALAGSSIVMGPSSELGPIDPIITIGPQNSIPAHFIINTPNVDPIVLHAARYAVAQSKKLATSLLANGMMSGSNPDQINDDVEKLATKNHFPSHGAVIDPLEAKALGLVIDNRDPTDDLWRRFWLLRCMYAADAKSQRLLKIFEGRRVSNALKLP